jgi:hypothetical protein
MFCNAKHVAPLAGFLLSAAAPADTARIAPALPSLTTAAYEVLNERVSVNATQFFIYHDADSGFNHGFPSGFIGRTDKLAINTGCVDDPSRADGCSIDPKRLDLSRGTVTRVTFGPLGSGQFAGIDWEEPQSYVSTGTGIGYDLTGATRILFSVRSPTGIIVQFGAGGQTTSWVTLPKSSSYMTACIAVFGPAALTCPPDSTLKLDLAAPIVLSSVNLLFTVATNVEHAPNGGIVLLDDIQYDPPPLVPLFKPSLPVSTQTFGAVPILQAQGPAIPFPPDQVNRNIAALYEASLTILTLLARDTTSDRNNAITIAESLVYALLHDNRGDPLPVATNGAAGLHNAYSSGDLSLLNSEGASGGQAGQIRFAGFSVTSALCGSTYFCLVLDGATGGNDAFAILALVQAFKKTGNSRYLNAALTIGDWLYQQLLDSSGTGFGGYFLGYPDQGQTKTLIKGKSTENNADIFAGFTALANVEQQLGNSTASILWTAHAKIAGDFVLAMFDTQRGCFNAGTVPVGTPPSPGIDPTGAQRGDDVINRFDFLDANSFSYFALASSAQYRNAINWSGVIDCIGMFETSVVAAGGVFSGYNLVKPSPRPPCAPGILGDIGLPPLPCEDPNGVAWEFTGQAALMLRLSGRDAGPVMDNIRFAQMIAPFTDGRGLGV